MKNNDSSNLVVGSLVEDAVTGEIYQIIDRGTSYITVATSTGTKKKWMNEVVETKEEVKSEFSIEEGQITCFGFTSKNFDSHLSEDILEHVSEIDDLYAKHQIVKRLDSALVESNIDSRYDSFLKVESFFKKNEKATPFVVEIALLEAERTKLVQVLCSALGVAFTSTKESFNECTSVISVLNEKQKEVLSPYLKIADSYGLVSEDVYDKILDLLESNLDEVVDSFELEDILEAFEDADYSEEELHEEVLNEVLSVQGRMALSRDLKRRSTTISVKRERALGKAADSTTLLSRARKLALTMIKRRLFRKPADQLSRAEKERFEAGSSKRKALVARLAQKLVAKVRILQNNRLHKTTPVAPASTHPSITYGAS